MCVAMSVCLCQYVVCVNYYVCVNVYLSLRLHLCRCPWHCRTPDSLISQWDIADTDKHITADSPILTSPSFIIVPRNARASLLFVV